jgi:hypothetical protein
MTFLSRVELGGWSLLVGHGVAVLAQLGYADKVVVIHSNRNRLNGPLSARSLSSDLLCATSFFSILWWEVVAPMDLLYVEVAGSLLRRMVATTAGILFGDRSYFSRNDRCTWKTIG